MKTVVFEGDFAGWREVGRDLLARGVSPESVVWQRKQDVQPSLLGALDDGTADARRAVANPHVPRDFVSIARNVSFHRDPARWALLYRALWRITHGEPELLQVAVDDDTRALRKLEKEVRRDAHKMHAFVRFRRVDGPDGEHFIAFHRPDHLICPLVGPFFADRFASMRWTILTPDASVSWDGNELTYGDGVSRSEAPDGDDLESLWKTYYRSIFNPARIKLKAMQAEMPQKHWATMPETEVIQDLLREAPERVRRMVAAQQHTASEFVPKSDHLDEISKALNRCAACNLCSLANGPVMGEGPGRARVMLVGEQPGDQEDLARRAFVGPAGAILDRALQAAGLDRSQCYVTNSVKGFKHELHGKRRIHKRPSAQEVEVCKPWLAAEIRAVRPDVIIALGATPALALAGRRVGVNAEHGVVRTPFARRSIVTFHPASILRTSDETAQQARFDALVDDLKLHSG